ncbi:MAG: flagellar biosynthesis anti-sigma factor FlgM [Limnochordales bacterium]|nr:flagellar biosynthesis anti-sigma factor FlgM [Limnochordales bacterium]
MRIRRQEIENVYRLYRIESATGVREASRSTAVSKATADEVTISNQARLIQELKRRIAALPEVREEKVAELRAAIQQGTYKVSSQEIADKMLGRTLADRLK